MFFQRLFRPTIFKEIILVAIIILPAFLPGTRFGILPMAEKHLLDEHRESLPNSLETASSTFQGYSGTTFNCAPHYSSLTGPKRAPMPLSGVTGSVENHFKRL